jgi:hypothetical protein
VEHLGAPLGQQFLGTWPNTLVLGPHLGEDVNDDRANGGAEHVEILEGSNGEVDALGISGLKGNIVSKMIVQIRCEYSGGISTN